MTPRSPRSRRASHFGFFAHAILPDDRGAAGLEVAENELALRADGSTSAKDTGERTTIAVDALIFAIGDKHDADLGSAYKDGYGDYSPDEHCASLRDESGTPRHERRARPLCRWLGAAGKHWLVGSHATTASSEPIRSNRVREDGARQRHAERGRTKPAFTRQGEPVLWNENWTRPSDEGRAADGAGRDRSACAFADNETMFQAIDHGAATGSPPPKEHSVPTA